MSLSYQDLYEKRMSYYHKDIPVVMGRLAKGGNLCLAAAPATGDERFLEYLAYWLQKENDLQIILSRNLAIDMPTVREKVQKSNKKNILILPYFYRHLQANSEQLRDLYHQFQNGELQVVFKLSAEQLATVADYPDLAPFVHNIYERQPLNLEETQEAIQLRRDLHGWQVPPEFEKQIYQLSGGLLRIIKRLCQYIDMQGELPTVSELATYPTMVLVLDQIASAYKNLPVKQSKKLGLVSSRGVVRSKLLQRYLENTESPVKVELPAKLRTLFNYLYENRGRLVTSEELDDVMRTYDDTTLWANYKLISRLRKLVGHKYTIRSVKGKGYILTEKE